MPREENIAAYRTQRNRAAALRRNQQGMPVYKKKDDTIFGGFLKSAAKVINTAGKGLDMVRPSSAVVPRATSSGRLRTAGVKGATRGDYARFAGEQSGVLPAHRIRQGKGSAWDWVAIGAMGAGPVARAAATAARTPIRFGLTPQGIGPLLKAGGGKIMKHDEPLEDMLKRIPEEGSPGLSRSTPRRVAANEEILGGNMNVKDRIPWLINRTTGQTRVGPVGVEHAKLYPGVGRPDPEEVQRWVQGWYYRPDFEEDELPGLIELAHFPGRLNRATADEFPAVVQKGMYNLLDSLFAGVPDEVAKPFTSGFANIEERLIARQGKHRVDRLKALLSEGGNSDPEYNVWAGRHRRGYR